MTKHKLFVLCMLLAASFGLHAQTARQVLDAAAARMTQTDGIRAQFKATQFLGTTPQEETTGTLLISGRRFQMTTNDLTTWYDGQTMWAMMRNAGEVNVSEPTEEEQAALNPSTLINIYKKGYTYRLRTTTLRGKPSYEVHLRAKNRKQAYTEIYVDVEQGTYNPLCFRALKDGNWQRIAILSFQPKQHFGDETFTFPKKDYPNVEVIDLR